MKNTTHILLLIFTLSLSAYCQDYPDDFCLCEKQTIKSAILNQERILFIYLPNDYNSDTNKKYPVHYVADAPLSSNLYSDLIKLHNLMNYMPQSIVVGLSSDDRNHNLHPEKGADKYINFIEGEVIPFISNTYRTEEFKVLSGHSLSGDFALYTLLNRPDLFDAYIAGSPGPIEPILKIADNKTAIESKKPYKFVYASIGSEEFTDTIEFKQLQKLISDKTDKSFEVHFKINKQQNHISNMAINFQGSLNQLYSDWQFTLPEVLEKPASQLIVEHYNNLEAKFAYRPEIGEWEVLFPLMHQLAKQGDLKNAIDILTYCIELHPNSDQAHAFLAKAYFDTGDIEKGKIQLIKALELNPNNEFALYMKSKIDK